MLLLMLKTINNKTWEELTMLTFLHMFQSTLFTT